MIKKHVRERYLSQNCKMKLNIFPESALFSHKGKAYTSILSFNEWNKTVKAQVTGRSRKRALS